MQPRGWQTSACGAADHPLPWAFPPAPVSAAAAQLLQHVPLSPCPQQPCFSYDNVRAEVPSHSAALITELLDVKILDERLQLVASRQDGFEARLQALYFLFKDFARERRDSDLRTSSPCPSGFTSAVCQAHGSSQDGSVHGQVRDLECAWAAMCEDVAEIRNDVLSLNMSLNDMRLWRQPSAVEGCGFSEPQLSGLAFDAETSDHLADLDHRLEVVMSILRRWCSQHGLPHPAGGDDLIARHVLRAWRLLCQSCVTKPQDRSPAAGRFGAVVAPKDLIDRLEGQANVIEDLEIVIREELRSCSEVLKNIAVSPTRAASPARAEAAAVAEGASAGRDDRMLLRKLREQGEAVQKLDLLVKKLCASYESGASTGRLPDAKPKAAAGVLPTAQVALPAAQQKALEGRVAALEHGMAEIRHRSEVLSVAMQQMRDHAADALEDRVAAAVSQVHKRLAGGAWHSRCCASRQESQRRHGEHSFLTGQLE